MIIGTYILWALFYGTFLLLRLLSWLIERLEEIFTQIMATKMLPRESPSRNTDKATKNGSRKSLDERVRIALKAESGIWTLQGPEGQCLEYNVRQRSGTL